MYTAWDVSVYSGMWPFSRREPTLVRSFDARSLGLEEGTSYYRAAARRRACWRAACWFLSVVSVAAAAAAAWNARAAWNADADSVVASLRAVALQKNLSCIGTRDIGVLDRDWLFVGDTLMANPRVVLASGERRDVAEEATHCEPPIVRRASRHGLVHVTYDTPSFGAAVLRQGTTEILSGKAARCVQHMVDVFAGRFKCGDARDEL